MNILANWKTTSVGLAAIMTAMGHMLSTGTISAGDIQAIMAGFMGIFAQDA